MKNIKIKLRGISFLNNYSALIIILDKNNCVIYKNKICSNAICLCLKENEIYKIKVYFLNNKLDSTFIVNNMNVYEFVFPCSYYNTNEYASGDITFYLTDYYYNDLPIEKGSIILNG